MSTASAYHQDDQSLSYDAPPHANGGAFFMRLRGVIAVDAIRSLGSAEDWRYHPTLTDAL